MSQTYGSATPATSHPAMARDPTRVVLLTLWAILTLAALTFVLALGTNAPYADEWEFVPVVTGHEAVAPWLWRQHNEHRLPLPRAIWFALLQLTHDFRAGMVLQVALLAGLSLWLMRLAARLRGRAHWADAFFPITLLHLGHWENFLMGYQLCFALFAVLAAALGVVALRATRETAFRSGTIGAVLAGLLALCGGFGLPLALTGAAWVLYLAVLAWRTGPGWRAAVLAVLALPPVVYAGLYFQGYERPPHHPPLSAERGTAAALVAGETLAVSFGIGVAGYWWTVTAGLLVLGGFTLAVPLRSRKSPAAVGLIAVAAGVAGLALAVGLGRAGLGSDMGLWSRYSLLTWPLIGVAYLVWVQHGRRVGKWVPVLLCLVAALVFPANTGAGMANGASIHNDYDAIGSAARRGASPQAIAQQFKGTAHQGQEARAIRGIPMLRDAGIGLFAGN